MKKFVFIFFLLLALVLTKIYFPYKTLGADKIPSTTKIFDEINYVWLAKSFLQTGIPTAWSYLDSYGKEVRQDFSFRGLSIYKGNEAPSLVNVKEFDYPVIAVEQLEAGKGREHVLIVQPNIDHSFLAGIIYGLKTPNDVSSLAEIKPEQFRGMAAVVSAMTGLLLFALSWLLYGPLVGLLSLIIYSTVWVYLLASRFALIENVLIPESLLSLIFLTLSDKARLKNSSLKKIFLVLAGVGAGLALMTKEIGLASIVAGFVILVFNRRTWREILYFLVPSFIFGSLFYLYSFLLSPSLFLGIFVNQVNRGFFGPLNFLYAFYRPHFADFPLEGWWPFGFIALAFLFKKFESHQEILISFLTYLAVFLLFGGLNYPWYAFVFIPYLVMASAIFLKEMVFEMAIPKMVIFFLFPFSSSLYWGYHVFHQSGSNILLYRLSVLVFLGITILAFFKRKNFWTKSVVTLVLLIVLWKVYQWNQYGFSYIIANWGTLHEGWLF